MKVLRLGILRGRIEIKQYLRQVLSVIFTLLFPVMLLLIFGSIFSKNLAPGVSFSQYFVAGMVASGMVNTGFQQLAINIPAERESGALRRLRGTPMPPVAFFIGKALLVLVAMLVQVLLLLAVGTIFFHLKMPNHFELWIRLGWLVFLGTASSTVLGIALAGFIKSPRVAPAVVSPFVIILQFFSGVFVVFTQLPHWMQQIAAVFPLKWLTQGIRSVFLPANFASQEIAHSWEIGKIAIILIAWTIGGTILAIRSFKWSRQ